MKEKAFWRLVSLTPVVIPLLLFFTPMLWNRIMGGSSPPASVSQIFSLGTLLIAGIPYSLFLLIIQLIVWSRPIRWDRITSLLSPPAFLVFFITAFQIYWIFTGSGSWLDSPRALVSYSILVLAVGYLFVGLSWGLLAILNRVGVVGQNERFQIDEPDL